MQGTELQHRAAARAQDLPGAELTHPFGDETDVYKVRGKVFMLHTDATGEPIVVIKSAPDDARSLREAFEAITPGYHMNKKHWITLHPDGDLTAEDVDDLVAESYLLVVEGLPKARRPVDPSTFAHRGADSSTAQGTPGIQ